MIKRLIKKSAIDIDVFEQTLENISDEGRQILINIENYKFNLEQATRIISNDEMLSQKIKQKQRILDTVAGQIYGIVFDIENIDITQLYTNQQLMVNDQNTNNENLESTENMNEKDTNQDAEQEIDIKEDTEKKPETAPIANAPISQDTDSSKNEDQEESKEEPKEEPKEEELS